MPNEPYDFVGAFLSYPGFDYHAALQILNRYRWPKVTRALISEPSVKSLFIEMFFEGQLLAIGTGFVCSTKDGPVLVTNRHNVTGRDQNTNQCIDQKSLAIPDRLRISHNRLDRLGQYLEVEELLYEEDRPLWKEHPKLRGEADFVALPLKHLDGVQLFPYDLQNPVDMRVSVSEQISVVGFPFGLKTHGTAIWASGFIASEPELDYDGKPIFLIDCRTRKGQSGSAVIAHRNGAFSSADAAMVVGGGPTTRFLGIYSGRVNEQSDLGIVWKASAILELIGSV
jgi:hypothetical protein